MEQTVNSLDFHAGKKILFLSRWFPFPPDNGSKIRVNNLLKFLAQFYEIDLISFVDREIDPSLKNNHFCRILDLVPYISYHPYHLKSLLFFFSRIPRSYIDTYSKSMEDAISNAVANNFYDFVIASEIDTAFYATNIRTSKKVFEELEVSTQYELFHKARSLKDRIRYGLMWFKYHNFVSNLLDKFDACTVVSEKESSLINEITKNKVKARVIPNGIDLDNYAGFYGDPIPDTLIYTGALSYQANFDAVNYFLSEVFPLILANNPNVKLYITGNVDPIKAEKLPKIQNVIMTGYLEDIRPKLAQSWISIVPLRIGGGTRLKILESLALGTPIVATSKGAEGLEFVNGKEILIADQPREYANCILSLLRDPLLRNNLSINGKNAVASRYDWSKIGKYLLGVLEEL